MSAADDFVTHLVRCLQADPRLAWHFDPLTRSMELLTEAYAEARHWDVEAFRKSFYPTLKFERPGGGTT